MKTKILLAAILIAACCFQPFARAAITVGQERRISQSNVVFDERYSNIWLGNNQAGYTFLSWPDQPVGYRRGNTIRFRAYFDHEPFGNEIIVYEGEGERVYSRFARGCADDQGNVYLVWHRHIGGGFYVDLFFAKSSDFGQTWSQPQQLNSTPASVIEDIKEYTTAIGCNEAGNVYVLWLQSSGEPFGDIYFNRSDNFGQTWLAQPIRVNSPAARIKRTFEQGRPVFAFAPQGRIYAAWLDERRPNGGIYFNYSSDNGSSWQVQDVLIDSAYFLRLRHVRLSADQRGNVYVAWGNDEYSQRLLLRRSQDGGLTWGYTQAISDIDHFGPQWTRSRSGNANLAFDGQGSVYAFWRNNVHDQGDRAVLNFSRDFGARWSEVPVTIDKEYSFDTGEMCVDQNGRIFVVYGKQIPGYAGYHLVVNASQDKGKTWECSADPMQCRLDNASPTELAYPRYFQITCDQSGRASVIWYDHREHIGSPRGYFNTIRVSKDRIIEDPVPIP